MLPNGFRGHDHIVDNQRGESQHNSHSKPIGITYDATTREVWVSNCSETIQVFSDSAP